MLKRLIPIVLLLVLAGCIYISNNAEIEEPLSLWYPVTITFDGPQAGESASTFRDYRMDVTFSHGDRSLTVPGYFAADGDAANTGASSGNKWRVKFTPDAPGEWSYSVSFLVGKDVAVMREPEGANQGILQDRKSVV